MQAVILAAGMGTRLKDLTRKVPKCMIEVHGTTVAERMMHQLDKMGLSRVVLVVGFEGELLADYLCGLGASTPIEVVNNSIYATTNNIYSLWLAREFLAAEDTLLIESDLILEDGILADLMHDSRPTLALVDAYRAWMDGTVVTLSSNDEITAFIGGKEMPFADTSEFYKTVNVYKFSREFSAQVYLPALEAYRATHGDSVYYETVLGDIALAGSSELRARRLSGETWYEVDDLQDLDIAESLFAPTPHERLELLRNRGGGYWRYPDLIDAGASGLLDFPTHRMLEELTASLPQLLGRTPSGPDVGSILAGKLFGIHPDLAVMCNSREAAIKAVQRISPSSTLIDETYCELSGDTSLLDDDYLTTHQDSCVIHGLSEGYGFAGAPLVVVASGNHELIARIKSDSALVSIGSVDEYTLQIVEKYKADRLAAIDRTISARDRLAKELETRGFDVLSARTDAVIIRVSDPDSYDACAEHALTKHNILLPDAKRDNLGWSVRIGIASGLDAHTLANLLD